MSVASWRCHVLTKERASVVSVHNHYLLYEHMAIPLSAIWESHYNITKIRTLNTYNIDIILGSICNSIFPYYTYMKSHWSFHESHTETTSVSSRDTCSNVHVGTWHSITVSVLKIDTRSIQHITITFTMYILTIIQLRHGILLFFHIHLWLVGSIMQHLHTYIYYNEVSKSIHHTIWNHNHHQLKQNLNPLRNLILPFSDSFCLFLVYKQSI